MILAVVALVASCQNKTEVKIPEDEKYTSFGDSISKEGALSKEELFAKYAGLNQGDTINVKFRSKIKEVCSKKGCWMNMDLVNDDKVFVKFKDYAFFMPLNSKDDEAIVNGKAYLSVESVDELKHYAKDAGKSQAAIDSIVEPKTTYAFMADGVLIRQ